MINPSPQIGSLDFKEIKQNLIEYLQGQSIIKDYNFAGSVVQTLIDLMAYNTFYYSYYTNMIASEMFLDSAQRLDSIISLTKPLGFTVSGKRSSRAKIILSGLAAEGEEVPEHSAFFGINNDGLQYTFYTLSRIFSSDSDATLTIAEGTLINNVTAISSYDFNKQKFYILDEDIDISTVRVKVKLIGEESFTEWQLKTNVGTLFNSEENIYFIERINTQGFAIQFGIENTLGRSLVSGDQLEIRYLRSSGKASNNISIFSAAATNDYECGLCAITLVDKSASGLDEPSIPLIKFLAPKYFAAQNRAVTKNDYNGLLLELGLINDINSATVFGGEEIYPPRYGRVFVSLSDSLPEGSTVEEIIGILREKSVITVFPEYVSPIYSNFFMDFSIAFNDPFTTPKQKTETVTAIKSFVNSKFITPQSNKFNSSLDSFILSESIEDTFPSATLNTDDFSFFFRTSISGDSITSYFQLGNEIDVKAGADIVTITSPFLNETNDTVVLKIIAYPSTNRFKFLNLKQVSVATGQIVASSTYSGKVNISSGIIEIPKLTTQPYILTIPFKKIIITSSLNNVTNFYINKVDIK